MKILFVAPYVPNRIRVRPYQLIRTLVRRGHEVALLAVQSSGQEEDDLRELVHLGVRHDAVYLPAWRSAVNCAQSFFADRPLQAAYSWHADLANKLKHLVEDEDFDVVHVEHLRGSQYGIHLRASQLNANRCGENAKIDKVPIIWDSVDCISHLFEQASSESRSLRGRLMTRLELNRTRKYEAWLVQQFDQVLVTSPVDRAALLRLAREHSEILPCRNRHNADDGLEHKVKVLSNGVDLDYFTAGKEMRNPAQIVFTGKMSYHANVTAALHLVQDIMPMVWARRPDAEVWIVGKDPSHEVRALATHHGEKGTQHGNQIGRVVVTGTVPDLRPYLRMAAIAVAPMPYSAGIQNKVLEAMACGAPVVVSPQTVPSLFVSCAPTVRVSKSTREFADSILELLEQPSIRQELGLTGRAYVERHHSWDKIGAQLEEIYASAAPRAEYVS